ncbi:putative ZIP metal ion transporter [Talaromyces proteolyticus]|uniref:ZIP metal ion transporter n=1 Tax=Talaromyces proteolyticus TaxID=1131652 RepID=A0AAD4KTZ4_9EURO|nr:putative ZIP metal ion transporter [Talaromyces proteolyticus]KAH8696044.1 putative ZIP metal ion transporter [Talaromyces proteolyticus]
MGLDENDTRGWVMSGVSGAACIIGASIICVDVIMRSCCGMRKFDITTNSTFLSSSMGLSAGVMVSFAQFQYLSRSGLSGSAAAYVLIGLFLAGVVAISVFSNIVHRYIPSHIVDCNHTHEPVDGDIEHGEGGITHSQHWHQSTNNKTHDEEEDSGENNERSPLIRKASSHRHAQSAPALHSRATCQIPPSLIEVSMRQRLGRQVHKFFRGTKEVCDDSGPCYGFSQTCGTECQKVVDARNVSALVTPTNLSSHQRRDPSLATNPDQNTGENEPETPLTARRIPLLYQDIGEGHRPADEEQASDYFSRDTHEQTPLQENGEEEEWTVNGSNPLGSEDTSKPWGQHSTHSSVQQHHHHVPQNAFLSIGLQTSLAIALHKLPEGFITYATNHASPTLGLTVFLALFIHNITDGFALALPLYLAIRSRTKAIVWASVLGGVSQPAGAALAALWIWATTRGRDNSGTEGTSWGVYGGMFAVTAGIMTSVGLQLFSEGLCLTHNRNICIGSAIVGMGLLGVSFALTA